MSPTYLHIMLGQQQQEVQSKKKRVGMAVVVNVIPIIYALLYGVCVISSWNPQGCRDIF